MQLLSYLLNEKRVKDEIDVNLQNKNGISPLMKAVQNGK